MAINKYYNQPLFFGRDYSEKPQRPLAIMYGKKNIFNVYYCRNQNCLRHVCKTWTECHACGQKIDWSGTDVKHRTIKR